MTVIAAYRDRAGRVAIAADTQMNGVPVSYVTSKLKRVGDYVVGLAGAGALQRCIPDEAETVEGIATGFLEAVRAEGHGRIDDEGLWVQPCQLLIAGEGRVVEMGASGGLYEDPCGYAAIGAGAEVAVGVMNALSLVQRGALEPDNVAHAAVAAAIRHVGSCGGRVTGGLVADWQTLGCRMAFDGAERGSMSGLWRNDSETREGKYPIVLRRDGTVLEGPYFVVAYRDPCAAAAFAAYAEEAERRGLDPSFVRDVRAMAATSRDLASESPGDPDAPRHRVDDPATLAWARSAHGLPG